MPQTVSKTYSGSKCEQKSAENILRLFVFFDNACYDAIYPFILEIVTDAPAQDDGEAEKKRTFSDDFSKKKKKKKKNKAYVPEWDKKNDRCMHAEYPECRSGSSPAAKVPIL
jgi:hypothetical protein